MAKVRLDKYISSTLVISRKDASSLIKSGRISVNGTNKLKADDKVDDALDEVLFDGSKITFSENIYIMLNKPQGLISATDGEGTVLSLFDKAYADKGIVQALGSDGPCTEPEPLMWIHKACNNGDQSLTVQQALKMATYNTYWMSFDEKERGSLEAGKIADMVILSGNPYETDVIKLDTLEVEQLLLKGESYQKISQNPIGQVLKGMTHK